MNTSDIGRFISELRKEKGLTQKNLAEKLNVTDKAVSKWETGRSAPDISLLVSLSEILDVTVIEILKGERIKEESFPRIGDEVVIKTIKNNNRKRKCSIFIAVIIMLLLFLISVLSYPAYHFFTSVSADNEKAIISQSKQYDNIFNESGENMKIVKTVKKGSYFFYLLQSDNSTSMRIFETDEIFEDRISIVGGGVCGAPNEISLYCSGQDDNTINVFFGYGMTDKEYNYIYRGVRCTKPIKDELVLDVIVDIDDVWSHADIIYDE